MPFQQYVRSQKDTGVQGIGTAVRDVELVNFTNARDCYFGKFIMGGVPKSIDTKTQCRWKPVLKFILKADCAEPWLHGCQLPRPDKFGIFRFGSRFTFSSA